MSSLSRRVLGTLEVRMAYVMLVIGTLMSIAGAYAAITGYGIVQVEEGWASVIAGATLFTGGIITIALSLILRKLTQLNTSSAETPVTTLLEPAPSASDVPSDEVKVADDDPMLLPAFATESRQSELTGASGADPQPEGHGLDDGYKLETPSTSEHDLVSRPRISSRSSVSTRSSSDDWLDRAFADFDQDVADGTPSRKKTTVSAKPAERPSIPAPEPEPAAPAEVEEQKMETPDTPAPPTDPGSAVIGRYEADGTSYVMYADGSIEAQTRSGVYRFASMAELKAFIES